MISSGKRRQANMRGWFRPDGGRDLTPLHEVVAPTLHTLPGDIQVQLKRDFYKANAKSFNGVVIDWSAKHAAQDQLEKEVEEFRDEKVHRAFDETEVRMLAIRGSRICRRMLMLEHMQDFAVSIGINPPDVGKIITRIGAAKRLGCERWWRRAIRSSYTQCAEAHLRRVGFVHRRRQVYASDRSCEYRRQRKQRDRAMLSEMLAISDAGDQLNLFEVVEKSQANPALRRAELMTRMKGFETIAGYSGHRAIFVTATCPSAFHRMHSSGMKNERWQGFTPREGQTWLSKMWARIRSKLHRVRASIYGFRVAEPNHDATPHWHMVLFGSRRSLILARRYLSKAWRADYSSELGMWKHRITFKKIYPEQGSATGYIAKYIAKNIDGFQVGDDYEANNQDAKQTCDRVAAWASTHGIRQFQQIGGPPVGLWRELRRIRDVVAVEKIEAAREAADEGDWAKFILAVGGIAAGRNTQLTLWKEEFDQHGELLTNQYGEQRAAQVVGVECVNSILVQALGGIATAQSVSSLDGMTESNVVPHASGLSVVSRLGLNGSRIRTRTKCWRIQRKEHGVRSTYARLSRPQETECVPNPGDCDRSPGSFSYLGPVSITVREKNPINPRLSKQGNRWWYLSERAWALKREIIGSLHANSS